MKPGYENFLKLVIGSLLLLFIVFCSDANAQKQKFPCELVTIHKVDEISKDDISYSRKYYGEITEFAIYIELGGLYEYPYTLIECGSSGCISTVVNLKTKQVTYPRFDCDFTDDGENSDILSCYMINCNGKNGQ